MRDHEEAEGLDPQHRAPLHPAGESHPGHPIGQARALFAATALLPAGLAAGFALQAGWAVDGWPFATGRLSNLFIASIFAAVAAATVWVTFSREWAALRSSALFPLIALTGISAYLLGEDSGDDGESLTPLALVLALGVAYSIALVVLGARAALVDDRRVPAVVRGSFALFAVVLVAAGLALVLGADNVLPWDTDPRSATVVGFIFLGAASSYAFGCLRPCWGYAYGPLVGFLAYDLLLLPPLLGHVDEVVPEQEMSLVVYVAVLLYSAGLAGYYLLIDPATRLWSRRSAA